MRSPLEQLTVVALVALLAASAVELSGAVPRLRAGYWLSAAAAAVALVAFVWLLAVGGTVAFDLWSPAPSLNLHWQMDGLGAFLGAVVALVAVFSSVFAVRYSHPRRLDDAVYPLFVLSMIGVAGAGNVFSFFVMWELMALDELPARPRRRAVPRATHRGSPLPRHDPRGNGARHDLVAPPRP